MKMTELARKSGTVFKKPTKGKYTVELVRIEEIWKGQYENGSLAEYRPGLRLFFNFEDDEGTFEFSKPILSSLHESGAMFEIFDDLNTDEWAEISVNYRDWAPWEERKEEFTKALTGRKYEVTVAKMKNSPDNVWISKVKSIPGVSTEVVGKQVPLVINNDPAPEINSSDVGKTKDVPTSLEEDEIPF